MNKSELGDGRDYGAFAFYSLFLLPLNAFAYSENSGGLGNALFVFVVIAILGTIKIVQSAIQDQDPKLKPLLFVAGLIGINTALMFTSLAAAIISQFTISFLFLILLGTYCSP